MELSSSRPAEWVRSSRKNLRGNKIATWLLYHRSETNAPLLFRYWTPAGSEATHPGPRRESAGCLMNALVSPFIVVGLFVAILICLEIGRQIGRWREESAGSAFGAMENAVFALMGLLIAFTFSGAASRLDARRRLITEETNAIGTAYLRIDLLPSARQEALRESFRQYLDARLEFYSKLGDPTAATAEMSRFTALQREIWSLAIKACQEAPSPLTTNLVIP